jgi:uncharacterized protein (DUF1330 family)
MLGNADEAGDDPVRAHLICDLSPRDPEACETCRTRPAAAIARYGGGCLARGGAIETLEGDWTPRSIIVVVEFPSLAQARAWYRSAEYAEALEVRDKAFGRNLVLVAGIGDNP